MPGSPPSRITLPGTMPPPSTRLTSCDPLGMSRAGTDMTSSIGMLAAAATWRGVLPVRRTAVSLRLFQAPQAAQRPCHFGASAPQAEQTNWTLGAERRRSVAMGDESYRTYVRSVKGSPRAPPHSLQMRRISRISERDGVSMTTQTAWLNRLAESRQFFSLDDQRNVRPVWSMGGLAAGAVPAVVRSSHGYTPQLPSDSPEPLREARFGDFFRN